ncbi:aminotransferase [Rhodobacteraceae bacterium NNCM2]|nr:aminotransferase [Coraliihabitans acroporae]
MYDRIETETRDRDNGLPAETIREWDNDHYVHPWESMGEGAPDRMIAASAEGIYLYDPEGRRYIDGPGGMWCTQVGYRCKEIASAMYEQAMNLAYHSPWAFASEPSAVLARKIAERSPGDLNSVFFTTGGSTAVDSALRFAQFRNNLLGRPEKKMFIAREKGYHGSTYLSATVSGKERDKGYLDTERRLAHILPNVNPYIRPAGMSVEDWCDAKVADLEDAILNIGPEKIAAFIAEPILASGGVIVPAPGYHQRTWELCRKHDILYISDEVVTGFGRLGHWFASEDVFGVTPDIITCAKGLTSGYTPLGAMIVSDRLLAEMKSEDRESVMFSNGYTYSGHPVSCAAALANIEVFERDGLLEHVRAVSPRFQQRLAALGRFEIVGDARGMGLIGCIEGAAGAGLSEEKRLVIDKEFGARVDAKCEAMGLIVRPLINMCVVSPPLIITEGQIDEMFDILEKAVAEVQDEML